MTSSDALSIVIVTYDSAPVIAGTLDALLPQLREEDQLVVVDNASTDETLEVVLRHAPRAHVVPSTHNGGFAGGVNLGVTHADRPLLLLLNPDAEVLPGCLDALRAQATAAPAWGAWQALIVLPDGRINTSGGRVHFLGFGWAGRWGEEARAAPAEPEEVGFASGAAMCVRRVAWDDVGGFDDGYFMYGEDLDISLRLVLRGWGVGIVPSAVVRHDYEFERGAWKWFQLERNRAVTVLVTYPGPLLRLLAPTLLAFEVALLAVAVKGGWGAAKLRAWRSITQHLPAIRARRRHVQGRAVVGPAVFAGALTARLDGEYFASLTRHRTLTTLLDAYWRLTAGLAGRRASGGKQDLHADRRDGHGEGRSGCLRRTAP